MRSVPTCPLLVQVLRELLRVELVLLVPERVLHPGLVELAVPLLVPELRRPTSQLGKAPYRPRRFHLREPIPQ